MLQKNSCYSKHLARFGGRFVGQSPSTGRHQQNYWVTATHGGRRARPMGMKVGKESKRRDLNNADLLHGYEAIGAYLGISRRAEHWAISTDMANLQHRPHGMRPTLHAGGVAGEARSRGDARARRRRPGAAVMSEQRINHREASVVIEHTGRGHAHLGVR